MILGCECWYLVVHATIIQITLGQLRPSYSVKLNKGPLDKEGEKSPFWI